MIFAITGTIMAETKSPPKEVAVDLGRGVKLELVLIPAGSFNMGDAKGHGWEKPVHKVTITKPFFLGKYEVTQEQWESIMADNPSHTKGPKHPVECVSWDDCQQFLVMLNARTGKQGGKFTLPMESQWEYACRAGSASAFCFGDDEKQLGEYAWHAEDYDAKTHPVGTKKANAWGLFDMHGNVWEWCQDWFSAYETGAATDPSGPEKGTDRVYRGGCARDSAGDCRSAHRISGTSDLRFMMLGLRVCRAMTETDADAFAAESARQEMEPVEKWPPLAVAPFDANMARDHQEAWARHIGQPREVTNSIGMKLALIPSGEFKMGSGESAEETAAFFKKTYDKDYQKADSSPFKSEHPQHRVRITKPFYLGTHHVTLGQFRRFVEDSGYKTDAEKAKRPGAWGWNPEKDAFEFNGERSWRNVGFEQTDEHPVVNVSWNDATAFCEWLSRKEGKTYELPTEAQWEYSCRAGTQTRYCNGDDPEELPKVGNVGDATAKARFPNWTPTIKASDGYVFAAPVGQFAPNAFGLCDMHGNALQWCADWFGEDYYRKSPEDNPMGPGVGNVRVYRGGSWLEGPVSARSASRNQAPPESANNLTGFRVARETGIP